jgi:ferric-dicitrate binding protein FerR (iron transport regulator)
VRIKSYKEAVQLARCAGEDAANRRMRKAGRKTWTAADHDHAVRVTEKILTDLGFDIGGWLAVAGLTRNEPEPPRRKSRRQRRDGPVQLAFNFV